MVLTVLAFLVALGLLIAIHEYGHYRVAVACGVKVLRFSIGIGKPLLRWQGKNSETEFVLAALPLGGYVRMLDEREGEVPADQLHRAFNRQPLRSRAAIVAAGPAANLLLAIALYSLVNWVGMEAPKALLSAPPANSLAADAGVRGGELVQALAVGDAPAQPVESFENLRWQLTQASLQGQDARLLLQSGATLTLPLAQLKASDVDAQLVERIGILAPWTAPQIGEVMAGQPAQRAGLQPGDRVLSIDGQPVVDGAQLRRMIRASGSRGAQAQAWVIERGERRLELSVTPAIAEEAGQPIARIGAYVGGLPEMVTVQKGPLEGLVAGVQKTWDISLLSLQMMGRMVIGEASLKNLSGPLTIADYAGKSASLGWIQYLLFLAMISVSLGVLNLLPLPVLDGGHLMYYLWEGVTGRAVNDVWMERLSRIGIAMLLTMMCIAFFNDISRLWG